MDEDSSFFSPSAASGELKAKADLPLLVATLLRQPPLDSVAALAQATPAHFTHSFLISRFHSLLPCRVPPFRLHFCCNSTQTTLRQPELRLSNSSQPLSNLWREQPPVQHLHIFARVRGRGEKPATLPPSFQETHLASVSAAQAAPAPSNVANNVGTYKEEQVKHPTHNGRPIELHGPPIEIYDETFAKLKHDLSDLSNAPEPSAYYIVQTANLFQASAPIYNSEPLRTKAVYGLLRWLLAADIRLSVKVSEEKSNRLTTEGDAAICETLEDVSYGKKAAVVAYLELKNELGLRGEAGLQAALSLRKHVSQKNVRLSVITFDPHFH